ncbi:hypothetical protein [Actinomadura madurae]|uniref:hypothetical protein n=1 Tax=Actinomadura madurae TaxID=1993 RepID=UPI0020D22E44|nr:hypothetical protein [Actinomadura madurae]MCP9947225.1 hypothetical protein [Actinomadura madurae]MCP9963990.1 hypothetical protein [Actinomadura madurae]MCP9976465.1 hypothetical protein [Actinomadura madurae]MCQ0012658.1 hypothetical protein [Actinomadura madurae]
MSDETTPAPRIRNGGALWCDEHQRWECVKNRKQARGGGRCHMPAITGLPRCRLHAGVTVELAEVQGEAMDAWSATYGQTAVDPAQAVIGMLNMAVFRANFYASLLEEQVLAAQEDRAELDAEEAGLPRAKGAPPVGEGAGLIGHTYSADKEHGIFASGEAIRGLVLLEGQERDRVVKYAKAAHDMGIAERHIRVAEQQAEQLAGAIRQILDGLNLSAEQQQVVPQLVPSVLRAIASGNPAA